MNFIAKMIREGDSFRLLHHDKDMEQKVQSFFSRLKIRGLSQNTVTAYGYDLVHLFRWLHSKKIHISEFSYQDIFEYIKSQTDDKAKPRSINRRIIASQLFLKFLSENEFPVHSSHLQFSGAPRSRNRGGRWPNKRGLSMAKVKVPYTIVQPLDTKEINILLASTKRFRDVSIILLMSLVGLRRCEILSLEIGSVDIENKTILIKGKGRKERVMPIPDILLRPLAKYKEYERPRQTTSEKLFLVMQGVKRGQPMSLEGIRSLFRKRRKSTGLHHANPHKLRHSFAHSMIKARVSVVVLQKMMGHAQYSTTLKYVSLKAEDIAEQYFKAMKTIESHYVKG